MVALVRREGVVHDKLYTFESMHYNTVLYVRPTFSDVFALSDTISDQ